MTVCFSDLASLSANIFGYQQLDDINRGGMWTVLFLFWLSPFWFMYARLCCLFPNSPKVHPMSFHLFHCWGLHLNTLGRDSKKIIQRKHPIQNFMWLIMLDKLQISCNLWYFFMLKCIFIDHSLLILKYQTATGIFFSKAFCNRSVLPLVLLLYSLKFSSIQEQLNQVCTVVAENMKYA